LIQQSNPADSVSAALDIKLKNTAIPGCSRIHQLSKAHLTSALALLLAVFSLAASLQAQEARTIGKNTRKVATEVKPEYPATLRKAGIGGTVRLHATVLPNGNVSKVEIVGGNPILAESAAKAVMQWKYVPADWKTNAEIEVAFHP